jgi:hypothetical protein
MTAAVKIKAMGGESVSLSTTGTTFVVVTTSRAPCFVFVSGMGAQIDNPLGTTLIDGVQNRVIAKAGITSNDIQAQVRAKGVELKQKN